MKKTLVSAVFLLCSLGSTYALSSGDILADAGIIVHQNSEAGYRFPDPVLRQEVIGMAVKLSGEVLPASYECKSYFSDISSIKPNNWICKSVEIAADHGIVSRGNSTFRPEDKITRAEALGIILNSAKIDTKEASSVSSFSDVAVSWQIKVTNKALELGIIDQEDLFRPNQNATRGELFEMIKRIIAQSDTSDETPVITSIPTLPSTPIVPKTSGVDGSTIKLNTKFELDGIEYELLGFKKIDIIGSDSNPQKPKNDYFLFLEFNYKNISHEHGYNGDFILRDGENMYEENIPASVYGKYNLGYDAEISPLIIGTKRKKYVGFDVKASAFSEGVLRVSQWVGDKYIEIPMKNLIQ